jgi:hypothetical protein
MIRQPIKTVQRVADGSGRTLRRLFIGSPGIRHQVRRLAQFTDRGLDIGERGDGLVVGTTILRSGGKAETNETDNNERDRRPIFGAVIACAPSYFVACFCLAETNAVSTFGPMLSFSSGTFIEPGPPDPTIT